MKFDIFVIGKPDKFYLQAIQEYVKRLSRYSNAELHILKNKDQLQNKLVNSIYAISINKSQYPIASESLAEKINSWGISGKSRIAFIIGIEISDPDELMTFSPMEMEPGLEATILFEQIYRAYRIINNHPYHK